MYDTARCTLQVFVFVYPQQSRECERELSVTQQNKRAEALKELFKAASSGNCQFQQNATEEAPLRVVNLVALRLQREDGQFLCQIAKRAQGELIPDLHAFPGGIIQSGSTAIVVAREIISRLVPLSCEISIIDSMWSCRKTVLFNTG